MAVFLRTAAVWVALMGVAELACLTDGTNGDAGVLLAMTYGAFASFGTFGYYVYQMEK